MLVNERIAVLSLKRKFDKKSICKLQAPTDEKEDEDKHIFYAQLQEVIDEIPYHDVKKKIGDFNVILGKEEY